MSEAQRAAPTVLVKEKKMPATGTISRRTAGTPKLPHISKVIQSAHQKDLPRVCGFSPGDEVLLLAVVHLLELEVAGMRHGSDFASLQDDEEDCSDNRDEVEWEVHKVANYGLRCEAGERLADDLAQLANWITT